MPRKYELSETEALMAFRQVESHCKAIKNWIASYVEDGSMEAIESARKLVLELRAHEKLYAKLNVESHRLIDGNR